MRDTGWQTTARRLFRRRWVRASMMLLATHAALAVAGAQTPAPAKKNPLLKLAEPWPDAADLRRAKERAEALPLFATTDALPITIVGDFKTLNKDRDPNSAKRYPGELSVGGDSEARPSMSIKLGARGHVRRNSRACDFVPIRVEFPDDPLTGTAFEGQDALKLVVQCRAGADYEQYLLREYLAYRLLNTLTPQSFRARLARVTYVDATTRAPLGTRAGMFLEDDGDVAKRMEGRSVDLSRVRFADLDEDALAMMMTFNYMIGNTDFSIYALHNVRLVVTPDRVIFPVPYDFDISGLVRPPYAVPDRRLPIVSVRERLYRGPCLTPERVPPTVQRFASARDALLQLPDSIPGLSADSRRDVRGYLEDFYRSITNERDATKLFVTGCQKASTM